MATQYNTLAELMLAEHGTKGYSYNAWENVYGQVFEVQTSKDSVYVERTSEGYYLPVCPGHKATAVFNHCVTVMLKQGFGGKDAANLTNAELRLADKLGYVRTWCGQFAGWSDDVQAAERVKRMAVIDVRMGATAR